MLWEWRRQFNVRDRLCLGWWAVSIAVVPQPRIHDHLPLRFLPSTLAEMRLPLMPLLVVSIKCIGDLGLCRDHLRLDEVNVLPQLLRQHVPITGDLDTTIGGHRFEVLSLEQRLCIPRWYTEC